MSGEQPKLFGGYVLLKALGRGAMGDVHFARPIHPDRNIPTPVVVKRLHGELAERKGFVARFRHEAAVAVSVRSKHIAKVFDVGAVGGTLYIAMEYVDGWPLSKVLDAVLKSGRHASIASVIDLIAGGLAGLETLHKSVNPTTKEPLGIVHRDISPKNLMVGEDGVMRLIDLGLGKSNQQDWRTRTGVVMGSVGYMPPEQARGERVDHRADVYAMGVVAFEMLALRNYIKRGTLSAMMEGSANPKFMKPSEFRPDVPKGLDDVLAKALSLDRETRFQSATDFREALRDVVPKSHSDGGMSALLEELFGERRDERRVEQQRLIAQPLPEEPEEMEPTEVFVVAEGVLPIDSRPTKYVPKLGVQVVPVEGDPTEPAQTAATQLAGRVGRAIPQEPVVESHSEFKGTTSHDRPPPQHQDPAASTSPAGISSESGGPTPYPQGYPQPYPPGGKRMFSMRELLLCLVIAVILTALVVLWGTDRLVLRSLPPTAGTLQESPGPKTAPRRAVPAPEVRAGAPTATAQVLKTPAPPAPSKTPPPVSRTPKRRIKKAAPSKRPARIEETTSAATAQTLNEKLDRMMKEAAALKRSLPQEQRAKVMKFQLDVGRWKKVENLQKKREAVADLQRRLMSLKP